MISEKPIIMSAPMVRALLADEKTQTRRIMKPQPFLADLCDENGKESPYWIYDTLQLTMPMSRRFAWPVGSEPTEVRSPYGEIGDRLWVRETHLLDPPQNGDWDSMCGEFKPSDIPEEYRSPRHVLYRADDKWKDSPFVWRPSIFMPRWASRILLEITNIRVERLNEISINDCINEGAPIYDHSPHQTHAVLNWYEELWESINGKGSWERNDFVWVISFKKVNL